MPSIPILVLTSAMLLLLCSASATNPLFHDCTFKTDGHFPNNGTDGPFNITQHHITWKGRPMVVFLPLLTLPKLTATGNATCAPKDHSCSPTPGSYADCCPGTQCDIDGGYVCRSYLASPAAATPTAPLMVFMHGITAQIEMYLPNLIHYAQHGFVVVFPYIVSPKIDQLPITTNTDGKFLLRGIEMAKAMNENTTSPLYHKINMNSRGFT